MEEYKSCEEYVLMELQKTKSLLQTIDEAVFAEYQTAEQKIEYLKIILEHQRIY